MSDSTLLSRRFRRSPHYRLLPLTSLVGEEAAAYGSLKQDTAIFGVLFPDGSGPTAKAIDRDVALLWFTLSEPAPLPPLPSETSAEEIARLVLDGILEVEVEGAFLTGPSAASVVGMPSATGTPVLGRAEIDQASYEALRYGAALCLDEPSSLSARLYFHGRIPVTERWRSQLPDPAAIESFLGFASQDRRHGRQLGRTFRRRLPAPGNEGWTVFARRVDSEGSSRPARHKVYVCIQPGEVPAVIGDVIEIAARMGVSHWKVGTCLPALLRPDKLVLYVDSPVLADAVAAELAASASVSAALPHPLAFTRQFDRDGRVAVGIDPPRSEHKLLWMERESWRLWVTNRLAAGLLNARRSGAREGRAISYALERLRLDGVDAHTWAPIGGAEESLWS